MKCMKFSKLSLLSLSERRALQIDLTQPATVIVAGNGFGKSAILKSIYETLGAKPLKVDDNNWRAASVTSLLEFSIEDRRYSALRTGDTYTVLDAERRVLTRSTKIIAELAPFLADLLSFRLVLTDKKGDIKTPPPSFMFAPYYIDQDAGWQKPWSSFADLGMFRHPAKALAEYHSGLRPNAYYEAKAERDLWKAELLKTEAERRAVDQAARKIQDAMPDFPLEFDLEAFKEDTARLLREAQTLHDAQVKYRTELSALSEEAHVWSDQVRVLEAAIGELDSSFRDALAEAPDVECPMCGEHYTNHIADQFELAADKEDLIHALLLARQKQASAAQALIEQRQKIEGVESAIERTNSVLAAKREELTLSDIVAAQGRNEAQRVLLERLAALDAEAASKQRLIADAEQRMKETESRKRRSSIRQFFIEKLAEFADALDVDLPTKAKEPILGLQVGRGSVQPRALAAYYYAFLHTVAEHGSAVFCPIVIDAPNQQGQDPAHLSQIMKFLLNQQPANAQVIVGAESVSENWGAKKLDVTNQKKRVLREQDYEPVRQYVQPYLNQSLL